MTQPTPRQPTPTKAPQATSVLPLEHAGSTTVMGEGMTDLQLLRQLGGLQIQATVLEAIGERDEAQDIWLDAYDIVSNVGYMRAMRGVEQLPAFLAADGAYAPFAKPWLDGAWAACSCSYE